MFELILIACTFVGDSDTRMDCRTYKATPVKNCVHALDQIKAENPQAMIRGLECRRLEDETKT